MQECQTLPQKTIQNKSSITSKQSITTKYEYIQFIYLPLMRYFLSTLEMLKCFPEKGETGEVTRPLNISSRKAKILSKGETREVTRLLRISFRDAKIRSRERRDQTRLGSDHPLLSHSLATGGLCHILLMK